MHNTILPLIQQYAPVDGSFQFAFTYLPLFSVACCMIAGFLYATLSANRVALFVWIVPLIVLVYGIAVYPASVLASPIAGALHHYFAGDFLIPEYHNYKQLFKIAGTNPDMTRGMDQLRFTAPLYGAIAYSIGSLVGMKFELPGLKAKLLKMKPNLFER